MQLSCYEELNELPIHSPLPNFVSLWWPDHIYLSHTYTHTQPKIFVFVYYYFDTSGWNLHLYFIALAKFVMQNLIVVVLFQVSCPFLCMLMLLLNYASGGNALSCRISKLGDRIRTVPQSVGLEFISRNSI